MLNFRVFTLIFAVFLSYAGVELLSVSLQGFNAECINFRISHIWLFCDIFAYFRQKLVAMAMSLRSLQSELSSLDRSTTTTPVISNHILAISCRHSFICIYSSSVPKLVAKVTPLCSLCTGVSQMNSTIAQTLYQNQTLHGYVAYN